MGLDQLLAYGQEIINLLNQFLKTDVASTLQNEYEVGANFLLKKSDQVRPIHEFIRQLNGGGFIVSNDYVHVSNV